MIEEMTPAEWLEGDGRDTEFDDVDRISRYAENYITRPMRNFHTGKEDFGIVNEDGTISNGGV